MYSLSHCVDKAWFSNPRVSGYGNVHLDFPPSFQFRLKELLNPRSPMLFDVSFNFLLSWCLPVRIHKVHDDRNKKLFLSGVVPICFLPQLWQCWRSFPLKFLGKSRAREREKQIAPPRYRRMGRDGGAWDPPIILISTFKRDFKIQRRDGNEGTSLKKWICVLSVFVAIIPTYLLCQM